MTRHTPQRLGGFRATSARNHPRYGDPIEHYKRPSLYAVHKVGYLLTLALAIVCTLVLIANLHG
jgi:hypothetical protein